LPNETLSAIFTLLAPPTLVVTSRVSRRFNAVAERALYAAPIVTDMLTTSSTVPWRTLQWCDSLTRRPHLIDGIKRLVIRWQADAQYTPTPHLVLFCTRIADALRLLYAIEHLDIHLGPASFLAPQPGGLHPIERAVQSCIFPHLISCSLGADWAKGAQPYTHAISLFLTPHAALEHLRLFDHHLALTIPTHALPRLYAFRGFAAAAASLLPGRPVAHLALVGQDSDITHTNLPLMTQTRVPLRTLDLAAISARLVLLRAVAAHFPAIEILRVRLALRHTLHFSFSGIRILAALSPVLGMFFQLVHLDLSPTESGHADPADEHSLCREWARACPSLRKIVFPSQSEWNYDDALGAWARIE
ncbi:hypothetical protein BD779DRAFT_1411832, partial [Infundibulicybe gibba]